MITKFLMHCKGSQHCDAITVIKWIVFILFMSNGYWLVSSNEGKIVGGRRANKGEFPYTLSFRGQVRCGATLVVLNKFLTAGSCFDPTINVSYVAMFGGSVDMRDKEAQEIYVLDYKLHSKFENRSTSTGFYILNDIAIGTLESSYVQTDTLSIAVFPATNAEGMKTFVENVRQKKQTCLATGYGAVDVNSPVDSVSFFLKVVEVQLLPDGDCSILPEMIGKEICGSALTKSDHTYVGDTGATLVCGGKVVGMTKDFKKVDKDGKSTYVTTFLLFGPYLDGFSLGTGKGNSLFHHHPIIFLPFLAFRLNCP